MKKLALGRKKLILAALLALLFIALIVGSIVVGRNNRQAKVDQKKEVVQTSYKEENGGCNDQNKSDLSDLYNRTNRQEDKAMFAEQIALCELLAKNYQPAMDWYANANKIYKDLNNQDKIDATNRAIESAAYLKDYNPPSEDGTEGGGEL